MRREEITGFRRAIFELLIGKRYQSYYSTLAQFRIAEQERNKANHALELFSEMSDGLVDSDSDATEKTKTELNDLRGQATRLFQYRGELAKAPPPPDVEAELAITQQKYIEAELELAQIARAEACLLDEAAEIERLKADLIVEATQVKKMMFANEKLALFDADTCPYCLHPVQRVDGQCICGHEIHGGEFVKFFYNEQEYVTILKSKQKNVETLKSAAESILAELKETRVRKQATQVDVKALQVAIRKIASSSSVTVDVNEFEKVESKLNEVRERIRALESVQKLLERQTTLQQKLADCKEQTDALRRQTEDLEGAAERDMESQRRAFSERYGEMMRETVSGCRTASIDLDYMPILNEGEYKQASAAVPRRLLYFATLLHLSLTNLEVRFPRFLLIDTPDTAGIDDNNLDLTIQQLSNVVYRERELGIRRQVILTTGVGKYPHELEGNVFAKLRDVYGQQLLKARPSDLS